MMKIPQKVNELRLGGNVANVDIRTGQHGSYGSCVIAVDDGYFKKADANGQGGGWVDRVYFHPITLKSNVLKKINGLNKGDFIIFTGKLVEEKWKDRNTGEERKATKMEATDVEWHIDADSVKQLRQQARDGQNNQGQRNNKGYNQRPNQSGSHEYNTGGYNQGGGHNPNMGGYNQHGYQAGDHNPNMGGYNQNGNQGGGHNPNMGGYNQHGNQGGNVPPRNQN
ncbi:single-stranded DNA-binding protein [Alteromonas sp. BZK5]|uniref:single-stranded DNA-binding protein n=1 Tax=Alteromonas sp. BZK5 TaxID=1904459 RepID=UPI001653D1CA|nr:single-stranded DNA-binding protein [Alteromonas sp. BZK5]MBC6987818.1 single-stranded DNA-binding protein [Alteromonas sp. BZK5]